MDKVSKSVITTIILIVSAGLIGFSLGKSNSTLVTPPNQLNQTRMEKSLTNPLFKSQTATFQGEITKVSGKTLSVKNDSGQTGTLPVSSKAVIYKFKPGSSQASASSDLKSIETGKQALIVLELMDGEYQVTQVTYLPTAPKASTR